MKFIKQSNQFNFYFLSMFGRMDVVRYYGKGKSKVENSIEQIKQAIAKLDRSVLTIYLNTNPANEDWKILLKNGLKKTEEYIQASNPEQVQTFKRIRKKVEKHIKDEQMSFTNSLVCFATEDDLYMQHFQFPVENDFQWNAEAATEQLDNLFEKYPKSGVVLLQRDKITLISASLGELIDEVHYEFDVENENWTQYKGLAYGNVYASSANHRDKYDRRVKENQERWFKSIVPTIEKHARNQEWQYVHLAGPAELTQQMKNLIQLDVTGETTRNYSGKSAHDILTKTVLV